jgi:hypothetical protein
MSYNAHHNKAKTSRSLWITCECGHKYKKKFIATEPRPWEAELKYTICPKCLKSRFPKTAVSYKPSDLVPENLFKLRKEGKTFAEIARVFGVSDRTIRRRIKLWTKT